jgi:hypothetical protein
VKVDQVTYFRARAAWVFCHPDVAQFYPRLYKHTAHGEILEHDPVAWLRSDVVHTAIDAGTRNNPSTLPPELLKIAPELPALLVRLRDEFDRAAREAGYEVQEWDPEADIRALRET